MAPPVCPTNSHGASTKDDTRSARSIEKKDGLSLQETHDVMGKIRANIHIAGDTELEGVLKMGPVLYKQYLILSPLQLKRQRCYFHFTDEETET